MVQAVSSQRHCRSVPKWTFFPIVGQADGPFVMYCPGGSRRRYPCKPANDFQPTPQLTGWSCINWLRRIRPMAREEQHTWGREHRRDGSSEWPSTSFSTISGEAPAATPSSLQRRRRHKKSSYMRLAIPFMLALSVGLVGLLALARHFQG